MIVFKVSEFPTYSETFIVLNVVNAIENGWEVTILTNQVNSISASSQKDILVNYDLLKKVKVVKSIPNAKFRKLRNLIWDIFNNPILLFLFFKYSFLKRKFNYYFFYLIKEYYPFFSTDIFHIHFCDNIKPIDDLKRFGLINSKIIVSFHGYDVELLGNLHKSYIPVLNETSSYFVANSQFVKKKLLNLGLDENRVRTVYNGINISSVGYVRKSIPSEEIILVSVGRLVEVKGHIFALLTILELVNKGYKLKYQILGDGPELQKLIEFVRENNLESFVDFRGRCSQIKIFETLQSAHVFLFPSTSDSSGRNEAFGVASLEAQYFGLPVIGFNVGGFPETVIPGITGFLLPDQDFKGMALKVIELFTNPDLYAKMSAAAHKHILLNFNNKTKFKELCSLYEA